MSRTAEEWLFRIGAGVMAGAAAALFMGPPRYWPVPHLLDYALIAAGALATIPWFVTAYRDRSWWRAYRKGRITRDQYRAYRDRRTGWPKVTSGGAS